MKLLKNHTLLAAVALGVMAFLLMESRGEFPER